MSPRASLAALLLLAAVGAQVPEAPAAASPAATATAVQNPFKPFDRAAYEAHLRMLGATDAQLQRFAAQAAEVGVARAADDLLRAVTPAYDTAVKKSEAGDPTAALDLVKVLADTKDPVLGGHLRYHLARVFLDGDDPERAVAILNQYLLENINRTPLDGEAAFFYAQALAEVPEPEIALAWFRGFLKGFPDASERFRATAQQRIGEIERQREGQGSSLHSLADGMKKVTRELKKQKTDKPVQVEQQVFLEELQKLIEMYEEMEKKSSGKPSGNQQSSNPASSSALVDGPARVGSLEKRASLADRWGDMKDKDRKEVESAVQNSLPAEYRKMLEEYYKKLGTGAASK